MNLPALVVTLILIGCLVSYGFLHKYLKKYLGVKSKVWIVICVCVVWITYALFLWIYYVIVHEICGVYGYSAAEPSSNSEKFLYYQAYGDLSFAAICSFIFFFTNHYAN